MITLGRAQIEELIEADVGPCETIESIVVKQESELCSGRKQIRTVFYMENKPHMFHSEYDGHNGYYSNEQCKECRLDKNGNWVECE